jgi:type IV secretion system protein VirD4
VHAPTGVGKGVSLVIPLLFDCPDSMVVLDFKGENALLTAKHRRDEFGHRTVILDPFGMVTKEPDCFNPLDMIKADSPQAIDACRNLAEELVTTTGLEHDSHWNDVSKQRIAAMAAVVVRFGETGDRSLQTVRTLLTHTAKMQAAIKLMCASDAWGGMLSRIGHQLTDVNEKELASVLSTINRHLTFLDTLTIAASTSRSTFDPADLCKGKMTVYLVIPPTEMRAQASLLRIWIGSLLRAVVANAGLQESNKVHFVLDEAASLGHLPIRNSGPGDRRAHQ